jgi:hypothetical protein
LNVIIGHVKVFIDHSKGPNSNSVTTPTAVISVRGTIFDIVVEDDDGTTLVTVDEGLVQVRNLTAPGAEPYLKPGDSVRVFRGQRLIGQQIDKGGVFQRALRAATDALRVYAQQHPGGIPIGGVGGPGAPGAQGDKGRAAPLRHLRHQRRRPLPDTERAASVKPSPVSPKPGSLFAA